MIKDAINFISICGKPVLYKLVDGVYWLSIKSICDALEINYNRQYQNIQGDSMLSASMSNVKMKAPDGQVRYYSCLPEGLIFGWIFSIRSSSPALLTYKEKIYELFNGQFNGILTRRQELHNKIRQQSNLINAMKEELSEDPMFEALLSAQMEEARLWKELRKLKGMG